MAHLHQTQVHPHPLCDQWAKFWGIWGRDSPTSKWPRFPCICIPASSFFFCNGYRCVSPGVKVRYCLLKCAPFRGDWGLDRSNILNRDDYIVKHETSISGREDQFIRETIHQGSFDDGTPVDGVLFVILEMIRKEKRFTFMMALLRESYIE